MELSTQDYLKKTILDTQERVRDFMHYADKIPEERLQQYFREYAAMEGFQARRLQEFLEDMPR